MHISVHSVMIGVTAGIIGAVWAECAHVVSQNVIVRWDDFSAILSGLITVVSFSAWF